MLVSPKQEPTLNVQVIATARVPILMASALSDPGRRLPLGCFGCFGLSLSADWFGICERSLNLGFNGRPCCTNGHVGESKAPSCTTVIDEEVGVERHLSCISDVPGIAKLPKTPGCRAEGKRAEGKLAAACCCHVFRRCSWG